MKWAGVRHKRMVGTVVYWREGVLIGAAIPQLQPVLPLENLGLVLVCWQMSRVSKEDKNLDFFGATYRF